MKVELTISQIKQTHKRAEFSLSLVHVVLPAFGYELQASLYQPPSSYRTQSSLLAISNPPAPFNELLDPSSLGLTQQVSRLTILGTPSRCLIRQPLIHISSPRMVSPNELITPRHHHNGTTSCASSSQQFESSFASQQTSSWTASRITREMYAALWF